MLQFSDNSQNIEHVSAAADWRCRASLVGREGRAVATFLCCIMSTHDLVRMCTTHTERQSLRFQKLVAHPGIWCGGVAGTVVIVLWEWYFWHLVTWVLSCQSVTMQAWVHSQESPYGICVDRHALGQVFDWLLQVFLCYYSTNVFYWFICHQAYLVLAVDSTGTENTLGLMKFVKNMFLSQVILK